MEFNLGINPGIADGCERHEQKVEAPRAENLHLRQLVGELQLKTSSCATLGRGKVWRWSSTKEIRDSELIRIQLK